jgi:hypothetical protein
MDPDANLEEMRRLANTILEDQAQNPVGSELEANADRLAELVLSIDAWIRAGGFLPKAWQKNPSQST